MTTLQVLHITPHLGGGVGKALLTLAKSSVDKAVQHSFLLLEQPQKTQFKDKLVKLGCQMIVCPDAEQSNHLIAKADIVQLEWWNHPAIFKFLCERNLPKMRLLVWCHVSGLDVPFIPTGLIEKANQFLFTSLCSLGASYISCLPESIKSKTGIVSSGVGLPNIPTARFQKDLKKESVRFGYMGSLNFSKLHPKVVDYLAAVNLPNFQVTVWGDNTNHALLVKQCERVNKPHLLKFVGYTTDVIKALSSIDIFIYLLNPTHYGTAENVLLEAMSMGVVPIVLNNPAESIIVENKVTGLIVDNPLSFAKALEWLVNNPLERKRISNNAAKFVTEVYSPTKMIKKMQIHYNNIIFQRKNTITFRDILGTNPPEWYQACQANNIDMKQLDMDNEYTKYRTQEQTKGSLQHFLNYFPNDLDLYKMTEKFETETMDKEFGIIRKISKSKI